MNKIDLEHAGLEFVAGDKFSSGIGSPTIVEEFAWRTNTGVKPEYGGAIEWQAGTGVVYVNRVDELHWDLALTKWRPHLPKVEDKLTRFVNCKVSTGEARMLGTPDYEAVTAKSKPVFTQAMADAGELPPVGSEFKFTEKSGCDRINEFFNKNLKVIGLCKSNGDDIVVWQHYTLGVCCGVAKGLKPKPIQTEREIAVEYAEKVLSSEGVIAYDSIMLHILYEKGLLQTPKNNVT